MSRIDVFSPNETRAVENYMRSLKHQLLTRGIGIEYTLETSARRNKPVKDWCAFINIPVLLDDERFCGLLPSYTDTFNVSFTRENGWYVVGTECLMGDFNVLDSLEEAVEDGEQ